MTNEIALKPCPFCNSPSIDAEGWMSCEPDGSDKKTGPACDDCGASAASIDQWNTRALPAQGEPVRDQLVNALSAIEQRANESGTGEMGLLDTVHAMARIARVALALVKP